MPDDFGSVEVAPPVAPVRDKRRVKELVVRLNDFIPEVPAVPAVPAVLDEDDVEITPAVEAVAAVAAVPAGTKVAEIELRFTKFSSADEKTQDNPSGVVSQGGANLYKGANANALKAALFKAGARAEIEARLAEDNID